ncbi:MAG: condensation domain-containing protein, partial [Pyrinomonadaceae bacterium]
MLFYSLYNTQSEVYVRQIIYTLKEHLDVSAFERAWKRVVERHSILRTSIRWENLEEPVQEVHREVTLPFVRHDWRDLSADEQVERLDDFCLADRARNFELNKPPLLRLSLIRCGDDDYRLVWTFHHLISDRHSDILILKEVFALYDAISQQGRDLDLPPAEPFHTYCEWLKQREQPDAETYWRRLFDNLSSFATTLPKSSRGESSGGRGGSFADLSTSLSEPLTTKLRDFVKHNDLTLNTIVQGAWALLLSRYSGAEEVVFGATRACRRSAFDGRGAGAIPGPCINTLPMRISVSPEERVLPWLKAIRAQWFNLREFELTPLAKIQEWSGLPQGTQLFDSIVSFERAPLNSILQAQGGQWINRKLKNVQALTNYNLTLVAFDAPCLTLTLTFNRQFFDDEIIRQLLDRFSRVLEKVV